MRVLFHGLGFQPGSGDVRGGPAVDVASCFRGARPPVLCRAVCIVLAMSYDDAR
jgi:hypothetical protein